MQSKLITGIKQEIRDYLRNMNVKIATEIIDSIAENLDSEICEKIHEAVDYSIDEESEYA